MKWWILGNLVAAVVCGVLGLMVYERGRSPDEQLGACVPWAAALVFAVVAVVLVVLKVIFS